MTEVNKVQCDSKQVLIDSFEFNNAVVQVYLLNNKRSVKQYCRDTRLPFREGLRRFYEGGLRI
jgi:hypothetical protein